MDGVIRTINHVLGPWKRRILLMVGRGIITLVNDAGGLQKIQLNGLDSETMDLLERLQEYGLTSKPHPGSEAVIVFPAGDRSHGLIIAVEDRRYRLKGLADGEIALYDDQEQVVYLKRSGIHVEGLNIILKSDGVIRLDGDKVEIHSRTYFQSDVHGKGVRETWAGGVTYNTDSYVLTPTGSDTPHAIAPTAIPTEHPVP